MKKIIILMLLVICSFTCIFAQENYSEIDTVKELQKANEKLAEENAKLKKLIYEKATVTINGNPVETNGLLSGFSLSWTKYKTARERLINSGNYVEIAGEEVLQFKDNKGELKDVNVELPSSEKKADNMDAKKTDGSSSYISQSIEGVSIFIFLGVIVIMLIVFYINLRLRFSEMEERILYHFNKNNDEICSLIKEKSEKNANLLIRCLTEIEKVNSKFCKIEVKHSEEDTFNEEGKNIATVSSLKDLKFPQTLINRLNRLEIKTIEQLLNYSEEELSKTRSIGKKSLYEIKDKLAEYGLKLKNE